MKKLLSIILSVVFILAGCSVGRRGLSEKDFKRIAEVRRKLYVPTPEHLEQEARNIKYWEGFIHDNIDSLAQLDYIFYRQGVGVNNWAIIIADSAGLKVRNGSSYSNLPMFEDEYLEPFDTLGVLSDNLRIINWALDTLPLIGANMKPYQTDYEFMLKYRLIVYKGHKIAFVKEEDVCTYSGPDNSTFNEQVDKLSNVMFWLAIPDLRKKLPRPINGEFKSTE